MNKSPGHQKWPNHRVLEEPVPQTLRVVVNGETVAESSNVVRVREDDHPDRFYFPREDVHMNTLERTETTTECPFKGSAHYYSLNAGGLRFRDAVWTYEDPYEEHRNLAGRLAFYDDKISQIEVRAA